VVSLEQYPERQEYRIPGTSKRTAGKQSRNTTKVKKTYDALHCINTMYYVEEVY